MGKRGIQKQSKDSKKNNGAIFGFKQKLWQVADTLAFIRDALLPKLLSGEIQVKDFDKFTQGE